MRRMRSRRYVNSELGSTASFHLVSSYCLAGAKSVMVETHIAQPYCSPLSCSWRRVLPRRTIIKLAPKPIAKSKRRMHQVFFGSVMAHVKYFRKSVTTSRGWPLPRKCRRVLSQVGDGRSRSSRARSSKPAQPWGFSEENALDRVGEKIHAAG